VCFAAKRRFVVPRDHLKGYFIGTKNFALQDGADLLSVSATPVTDECGQNGGVEPFGTASASFVPTGHVAADATVYGAANLTERLYAERWRSFTAGGRLASAFVDAAAANALTGCTQGSTKSPTAHQSLPHICAKSCSHEKPELHSYGAELGWQR
jgi:hypothetical protein